MFEATWKDSDIQKNPRYGSKTAGLNGSPMVKTQSNKYSMRFAENIATM